MKKFINIFLAKSETGGVYKMIFDESEFYIGSTKNFYKRFQRWKHRLRINEPHNELVAAAFQKCEIVRFEIIEIVPDIPNQKVREDFFIKLNWGNPLLLNRSNDAFVSRFKRTDEQKVRVRNKTKQVAQFDLYGNLIKIHKSSKAACMELFGHRMPISKCFNRSVRTCGGFKWKRVNQDGTFEEPPVIPNKPTSRTDWTQSDETKSKRKETMRLKRLSTPPIISLPKTAKTIIQYDISGIEVNRFPAVSYAARSIGTVPKTFQKTIKISKTGYHKGYIWKYA